MAKILGESGQWQRVKGPYQYVNASGVSVYGNGDHMENLLSGEALPIRQFQNRQKAAKELQGIPRKERVQREGGGPYYRRVNQGERHGNTISIYFRDLVEAQLWFYQQYLNGNTVLRDYSIWVIQARYTTRNQMRFGGSDIQPRRSKSKFVTLSDQYRRSQDMALSDDAWEQAGERLQQGFTMGADSAIVLFGGEY